MDYVRIEDNGPVRHVVISRSDKLNALSSQVYQELGEAFADAARESEVRCVVVRGDGPIFSAGGDLAEVAALPTDHAAMRYDRAVWLTSINTLEEMTKPTIAQIHGTCIGGAAELVLACDFRVMATDATIALVETKLGLIPDLGGSSRLPALIGLGRAKELIMTGRPVEGEEAIRIGLVTRTAAPQCLAAATTQLVNELLANAPMALGLAKRVLDAAAKPALAATLDLEVTAQQTLLHTEDFTEGIRAVTQKRPPTFTAR